MKSVALGCLTALALTVAANAQSTTTTANGAADAAGGFISKETIGLVRAPKLVGVAVYDSNNKSVGKISDLLVDHDGTIKAVVIGVGGFLGIGTKDVAVPYSDLKWQTEQRTVAVNEAPANGTGPGKMAPATGTAPASGTTMANGTTTATDQQAMKKVSPAAEETYQGYPDRAVIAMSQEQLKSAPEFKYADNPRAQMNTNGATDTATPAAKP